MATLRWHPNTHRPTKKGWYECKAIDDRWDGETRYRGWGHGQWWIPLPDGWLGSEHNLYHWRGPVADIDGPAPDGTNPQPPSRPESCPTPP